MDSTRPSGPVRTSTCQNWSVQLNAAPLPADRCNTRTGRPRLCSTCPRGMPTTIRAERDLISWLRARRRTVNVARSTAVNGTAMKRRERLMRVIKTPSSSWRVKDRALVHVDGSLQVSASQYEPCQHHGLTTKLSGPGHHHRPSHDQTARCGRGPLQREVRRSVSDSGATGGTPPVLRLGRQGTGGVPPVAPREGYQCHPPLCPRFRFPRFRFRSVELVSPELLRPI